MSMSSEDDARELAERVYHAVQLTPSDGSGLSRHAVWDMQQLMTQLDPDVDLTAAEVMAIAVVLAGANERKLGGGLTGSPISVTPVAPRPLLRMVN